MQHRRAGNVSCSVISVMTTPAITGTIKSPADLPGKTTRVVDGQRATYSDEDW